MAAAAYAISAVAHLSFLAYLAWSGRVPRGSRLATGLFLGAVLVSGLWAAAQTGVALSGAWNGLPALAALLDIARYALWLAFLLELNSSLRQHGASSAAARLRWALVAGLALVVLLQGLRIALDQIQLPPSRWVMGALLSLPLLGLLLLEQLVRGASDENRWVVKPVGLGIAIVFVFDIYMWSEALLFGRGDADTDSARGVVHMVAVPFLLLATHRRVDWIGQLQVSRTAAFHSATLFLAGLYLLFISGVGYYVRYFGGSWGRALQLALLFAALAVLVAVAVSGSLRSWLRVFVGKHFFSYRYDYREEWLRFTAMLSAGGAPGEVGQLVVRGLANLVECPAGSLWTRVDSDGPFRQVATWNVPRVADEEAADSQFSAYLRRTGWVVDLDQFMSAPRLYDGLVVPTWLLGASRPWLVVPLLAGNDLLGFVLLAHPRARMEVDWEVLDLLKTAGRQAAGYLAQLQATEALLEARKFDAFNRMSAFVVHDLKNIVTQLSLMLKNAERLHANPEFQQDMLLTVQSSLEKMKRMMLQLREGAAPAGSSVGVELPPIVQRLQQAAHARGRELEVPQLERLATRGHEERLERVLGHLVHNALDATPAEGRVWMSVQRHSGQVRIEVGDTGSGMTEEFVRTRLFRPFNSTKPSGMGVGSHESAQYVRELGGSIRAESQPGVGTRIEVLLPLFELRHDSDLMSADFR